MEVNETHQETSPVATGPSKKQQFAAVALSTVVSVVLAMGANYVIDKAATQVKNAITAQEGERQLTSLTSWKRRAD